MQNYILENIESKRLQFRKLKEGDYDALMSFFKNPEAVKYLGMTDVENASKHCKAWIQRQLERYEDHSGLMALVSKSTGQLVGQCGLLKQTVDGIEEIEIGYHIQPQYWRLGFATEASQKCKEIAFGMGVPSVISIIGIKNFRSVGVAQKNLMKLEKQTLHNDKKVSIYRVFAPVPNP